MRTSLFAPVACLLLAGHVHGYAAFVKAARKVAIDAVKRAAVTHSSDSWVSGALTEALLQLDYPALSVFGAHPIPIPKKPIPNETNKIVAGWSAQRAPNATQFIDVAGGAAGDPASLGVAWILAEHFANGTTKQNYAAAVQAELTFQLDTVKRASDGAISTRPLNEPVQFWSDWVFMVPPFLAYYGATYHNESVLQEAFTQISLYRNHLQDKETKLWRHIVEGDWNDMALWGTGNAWAAAGMLRVLATIDRSDYKHVMKSQRSQLITWMNEIIDGAFAWLDPATDLLQNVYFQPLNATFPDAASSTLMAATALRAASQGYPRNHTRLAIANRIRASVNKRVNPHTGWMTPVVDPFKWYNQTDQSPEGATFVMQLAAAGAAYDASCRG